MHDPLDDLKRVLSETAPENRAQLLEAVAAASLIIARAAGEDSPAEIERISATLSNVTDGGDLERIEGRLQGHWRELNTDGLDALLADLAAQLPDPSQRRLALACAAAVAFADGYYDFEEEVLLARLATAFGISDDEVRKVVEEAQPG